MILSSNDCLTFGTFNLISRHVDLISWHVDLISIGQMSRAIFKKLSGHLRAEWFSQLADKAPVGGIGQSPSVSDPLPQRTRGLSGKLYPADQSNPESLAPPRAMRSNSLQVSRMATNSSELLPYITLAENQARLIPTIPFETQPGEGMLPGGSGRSPRSTQGSEEPWEGVPNAPGSGQTGRSVGTSSALHHPAISRVLKVNKLHEPYISKRELRERSNQQLQTKLDSAIMLTRERRVSSGVLPSLEQENIVLSRGKSMFLPEDLDDSMFIGRAPDVPGGQQGDSRGTHREAPVEETPSASLTFIPMASVDFDAVPPGLPDVPRAPPHEAGQLSIRSEESIGISASNISSGVRSVISPLSEGLPNRPQAGDAMRVMFIDAATMEVDEPMRCVGALGSIVLYMGFSIFTII